MRARTLLSVFICSVAFAAFAAERAHAVCNPTTPNGSLHPTEACDDGNSTNGDGCNSTCDIEANWSCDRPVSFTSIVAESYAGASANWNISNGGRTGTQTTNTGHGTFGLFGASAFTATYTFQLRVATSSDDDFIGFALGFGSGETGAGANTNYLLLDWKQADQASGNVFGDKGMALSHVTGAPSFDNLWGHTGPVTELIRGANVNGINYSTTGWADNTTYSVEITYRSASLRVLINGNVAFNVLASQFGNRFPNGFPDGQIAFYGLSQEQVQYTVTGPFGASSCNRAPAASDRTAVVASGTNPIVVDVTQGFTDPNGNTFNGNSVRVTAQPTGATAVGAAGGTAGRVTLTPANAAQGSQQFVLTYEICDNHPTVPLCDTAQVTAITGPSVANDTLSAAQGSPVVVSLATLIANDNNNNNSRFTTTVSPTSSQGGTVSLSGGNVTYTPNPNFSGTDTFTYTHCNTTNTAICRTATVTVSVNGRPTLSAATTCVATGTSNTTLNVANRFSDPNGGILARIAPNAPAGGTLNTNANNLIFTPTNTMLGTTYPLSYSACDNQTPEACGTGTWAVTYNDPPAVTTAFRGARRQDVLTIPAASYLTSFGNISTGFANYAVSNNNNTFSSSVALGTGSCSVASNGTVTIGAGTALTSLSCYVRVCETCTSGGEQPACSVGRIDIAVRACLSDNDCSAGTPKCDTDTWTCVSVCGDGTLNADEQCDDGNRNPNDGCSATCQTESGWVCGGLPTSSCNRPPVVNDYTVVYPHGAPLTLNLLANYSDPDNTPANVSGITITKAPPGANVRLADGGITIAPLSSGGSQRLEIEYLICDNHPVTPLCDPVTVTVVIGPSASDDLVLAAQDTPRTLLLGTLFDNAGNVDHSLYSIQIADGPTAHGQVLYNAALRTVTYLPGEGFFGEDAFTYTLCATASPATCVTADVAIHVNGSPVLAPASVCVATGTATAFLSVPAQYSDPDGDAMLSFSPVASQSGAHNTAPNQRLAFSPSAPNTGARYTLSYNACDSGDPSVCATGTWEAIYNDPPAVSARPLTVVAQRNASLAPQDFVTGLGNVETGFLSATVASSNIGPFGSTASLGLGASCSISDGQVVVRAGTQAGTTTCHVRVCESCTAEGAAPACALTRVNVTVVQCQTDDHCGGNVCAGTTCVACENTAAGNGIDRNCTAANPVCTGNAANARCVSVCGDGVVADNEQCDDGNVGSGDGCSSTCRQEAGHYCAGQPSVCATDCGDGIVAGLEQCDDGNELNEDGCSSACWREPGFGCEGTPSGCVTVCGDGVVAGVEACDDGNTRGGDGCSSTCAPEGGFTCNGEPSVCLTTCGDGIVAGAELCDDADTDGGDGCSATCMPESGYTCTGSPSTCVTTCGDGIVAGDEQCDDDDTDSGDGCSASCVPESGYTCSGSPSACVTSCGDGVVTGDEQCDDGDVDGGDGCSAGCLPESGYMCSGSPSVCVTSCGDGILAGAELCDDNNTADGDGCSMACAVEDGWTCEGVTCGTTCGDGIIAGEEACDDDNTESGDGCSAECVVEHGFACTEEPSVCASTCGDGLVASDERCDDGNELADDGCTSCDIDSGYACAEEPSVCSAGCGDGIIAGAEGCDDGDAEGGDGCSESCQVEDGWECESAPSSCNLLCGNGELDEGEACDDGGVASDDGCSASCTFEEGWSCEGEPLVCVEDADNDSVTDDEDNCPTAANPDQSDLDGDGTGDVCDSIDEGLAATGGGGCMGGEATAFTLFALGLVLLRRRRLA